MKNVFVLSKEEHAVLVDSVRKILMYIDNLETTYWSGEIERLAERIRDEVLSEADTEEGIA